MKRLVTAGMAAAIAATAARADPAPPAEARIAFVNHGGIYDWEAPDRRTLYIQDRQRHWYRASFLSDCIDLDFGDDIGFDAGETDTLDRTWTVIAHGQRCPIASLVAIDPPPPRAKKR